LLSNIELPNLRKYSTHFLIQRQ